MMIEFNQSTVMARTDQSSRNSIDQPYSTQKWTDPWLKKPSKIYQRLYTKNDGKQDRQKRAYSTDCSYIRHDDFITVAPIISQSSTRFNNDRRGYVRHDDFITVAPIVQNGSSENQRRGSCVNQTAFLVQNDSRRSSVTAVEESRSMQKNEDKELLRC